MKIDRSVSKEFYFRQSSLLLNLNAFPITDTELKLIAKAAIIGDNNIPKKGNRTPAATGTPIVL